MRKYVLTGHTALVKIFATGDEDPEHWTYELEQLFATNDN